MSDDDYKLNAVTDIVKAKCTKRGVSLKAFTYGLIEPALGGPLAGGKDTERHSIRKSEGNHKGS